jgi:hypothetical protein
MEKYIAEPFGIDDGYGIIGAGFKCGACGRETLFVTIEKDTFARCEKCGAENYCEDDYEC